MEDWDLHKPAPNEISVESTGTNRLLEGEMSNAADKLVGNLSAMFH